MASPVASKRPAATKSSSTRAPSNASLVRLQQRGWISAEWGTSDNNRKAKYYAITRAGRKQWAKDTAYWNRLSMVMGRVLAMPAEGDL
jgi:PadR family transcriptional regulator, regulatory protein PadR